MEASHATTKGMVPRMAMAHTIWVGAEIEMGMGPDFERHYFNKPTAVIAPKGFIHLPCITRWVDDPYAFVVGCLSAVHDAPWVNPEDLE